MTNLIAFDMDGTLLDCETLDVLAEELGIEEQIATITKQAMEGKIPLDKAIKQRLELLKSCDEQKLIQIAQNMPLAQGAHETIAKLKQKGFYTMIITGGFETVAEVIAKKLDVDCFVANKLEIKDGKLTGNFKNIVKDKAAILKQKAQEIDAEITIAVGDGANDIPMLEAADIGVGYRGKDIVKQTILININNLLELTDMLEQKHIQIAVDKTMHPITEKLMRLIGDVKVFDTAAAPLEQFKDTEIILHRTATKIRKDFLDAAEKLMIDGTATSGLDHIDMEYAEEKGLKILDALGANADTVADYVWRALLHITDDVVYTNDLLKREKEFKRIKKENTRNELRGKTIGIIGYGNVGHKVAERARAFGMKVLAYDPYKDDANATLNETLQADVVTLHPTLTQETRAMIGKEQFALMKPNAIFINTSRGEIVVDEDLVDALKNKKIGKAIIDVFQNEPLPNKLYELPNTICTPHIGGNSIEGRYNCARMVCNKILAATKNLIVKEVRI